MHATQQKRRSTTLSAERYEKNCIIYSDMRDVPENNEEARARLAAVRKKLGWTLRRMADYYGDLSTGTVHAWVQGRNTVPPYVRDSIPFLEAFAEDLEEQRRDDRVQQLIGAGAILGSVMIYEWLKEEA